MRRRGQERPRANQQDLLFCSQVSNVPGTWIEEGSAGGLLRLRSMKGTPV